MRAKDHIFVDLFAFGVTLAFAIAFRWEAQDVAWGLWASGFCVGYVVLFRGFVQLFLNTNSSDRPRVFSYMLLLIIIFSLHFILFHAVNSTFIHSFFPIGQNQDLPPSIFSLIHLTTWNYWPLVLMSLLVPLAKPYDLVAYPLSKFNPLVQILLPYLNVIRMQVMIAVLILLELLNLRELALYSTLLFYFLPWDFFLFRRPNLP